MIDEETLAQINGPYQCPSDAGPAWRVACEYGFDMSLVEDALIASKEAVGRERDLAAVRQLLAIKERRSGKGA